MKYLGLDIGDRWTGVALSDSLGMLARPLTTVATEQLAHELVALIKEEDVSRVIVGLPLTLKGTDSDQTKKVRQMVAELQSVVTGPEWVLFDERLSSKAAARMKTAKTREEKLHSHAVAAAIVLNTYLATQATFENEPVD